MMRRMLISVVCLLALGAAVPAAAAPTPTTPSTAPSSGSVSGAPATPTGSADEPSSSADSSSAAASPADPSSTTPSTSSSTTAEARATATPAAPSSTAATQGQETPTAESTAGDGPGILSAGGPLAVYVTTYCTGPGATGQPQVVVDNPAANTAYTYRVVAQPGTDPVDLTGAIPVTPAGPRVNVAGVPSGTYTVEVTGDDDTEAVSAPFTLADPCADPPLIFFTLRQVPCGPGDESTGVAGNLENPKDDEVYTWVVINEDSTADPITGPVAADGTFAVTGLAPGTYSIGFFGDEGSAFETNSFAVDPCPTQTTPPPSSSTSASSPPSSATPSSAAPTATPTATSSGQGIASVDPTGGGLAATGAGRGLLGVLLGGGIALMVGLGVLLRRSGRARRG